MLEISPIFFQDGKAVRFQHHLIEFDNDGYNRATDSKQLLNAESDAEVISAFLDEYKDSPNTLSSYAKEIERLLLWCIHVSDTGLTELTREDIVQYESFITGPEPYGLWCGKKVARLKKDGSINPDWRPFFKPLSKSSSKKALKILDSFFSYLVEMHYLQGNPVALNRRRKKKDHPQQRIIERYLEMDELVAVLNALSAYPIQNHDRDSFRVARARYIILLLFYSGMRISEASNHTMGNFIQRDKCWFLNIVGKGKKPRDIPVPDELLKALADFRKTIGLPFPEPEFKEETPLIPNVTLKHALQVRRIDQIVKWAFHLGADSLEIEAPRKASKLRQASAHWLRHSYVTYLLDAGAPLKVAQENAGHSDISTTMLYRHVSQTNRHTATRHLSIELEKTPESRTYENTLEKQIQRHIPQDREESKKTITLRVWLMVENNNKFVRGKGKSLKEIENYVFAQYEVKKPRKDSCEYQITLPYNDNDRELDELVYEIVCETESIADSRNGFIEIHVGTLDGEKSWPFSDSWPD